jgi:hypothetical protein
LARRCVSLIRCARPGVEALLASTPRGNVAHQPVDLAFQESPIRKANGKPQIMKGPKEFPEIRNNARSKR